MPVMCTSKWLYLRGARFSVKTIDLWENQPSCWSPWDNGNILTSLLISRYEIHAKPMKSQSDLPVVLQNLITKVLFDHSAAGNWALAVIFARVFFADWPACRLFMWCAPGREPMSQWYHDKCSCCTVLWPARGGEWSICDMSVVSALPWSYTEPTIRTARSPNLPEKL